MKPFVTNKYPQICFSKLKLYDLRLHRQIRFVKQIRVYLFVIEWSHVHTGKYLCANQICVEIFAFSYVYTGGLDLRIRTAHIYPLVCTRLNPNQAGVFCILIRPGKGKFAPPTKNASGD